ncbi:MAG: hypothetical protein HY299_15155 [Verrucomicrobia bacterium]|nr:hypothetical protein [Verrucomicrobiota bacterium]
MTRLWLGIYLLASAWLFGTDYFYAPRWSLFAAFAALGVILIASAPVGTMASSRPGASGGADGEKQPILRACCLWLILLLPVYLLSRWPDRLAPLLAALGSLALACAGNRAGVGGIAGRLTLAALMVWTQSLVLTAYKGWTARSHELPDAVVWVIHQFSSLLGVDIGRTQSTLMLSTMRETHALGGTWEFFLDPPTLCFIVGGAVCLALSFLSAPASERVPETKLQTAPEAPLTRAEARRGGKKPAPTPARRSSAPSWNWSLPPAWRPLGIFAFSTVVWLLLRSGLLIGLYLHRALVTDYDAPLSLMSQFWNPWVELLFLLPLAIFQMVALRSPSNVCAPAALGARSLGTRALRRPLALSAATALMLILAFFWDPVGQRKPGRVAVDEHRTRWEPTGRPFDTEWYGHLSGYNYASIYDYCSRFYDMSRITNVISDATLADLDVLVVKVPTDPYTLEEIGSINRFVERGGGVLMIGEHTDVFGTGYNLNSIARRFGFVFRYDCLFGIDSFFDQYYEPPPVPHPVVQHIRNMDFATSCSIQPLGLSGRSVLTSTGLKNSLADYHVSNYYPQAVDHAAMRFGAFVQLWAARSGSGRVLAFTDSTIFSNFCTFEPGKAEMMMGMLEWLNHRDGIGDPRPVFLVLGALCGLWTLALLRKDPQAIMVCAGMTAAVWAVACAGLVQAQKRAMPPPAARRPFVQITFDRTVCDSILPKNGFIDGRPNGFGIFERWFLRLGYFNRRESGTEALKGDLVVFAYPTLPAPKGYVEALKRYVDSGGRALIVDSPENTNSTAAVLLQPFQLSQKPRAPSAPPGAKPAMLTGPAGFPTIPGDTANESVGGQPFVTLDGKPVATTIRSGRGTVTLISFGSTFTDAKMGVTGDVEPNEDLKKVFDFQFALARAVIGDKLIPPATAPPSR